MKMTAQDWYDAADIFQRAATEAQKASGTRTAAAIKYAVERMNSLELFATNKAVTTRRTTCHCGKPRNKDGLCYVCDPISTCWPQESPNS